MKNIIDVCVKAVNQILARGLNHRQIKHFLKDLETEYGDSVYFSNISSLTRESMLKRVLALHEEIATFLESKFLDASHFRDPEWLQSLAFLVDITSHLNNLNLQLQGKRKLIHELYGNIVAFERKLQLLENQLRCGNYVHFPSLQNRKPQDPSIFVTMVHGLREEFSSRFEDFRLHASDFKLFATPFDVEVSTASECFQMELIDLQSDDLLKSKFYCEDMLLLDFYAKYVSPSGKYPNLANHAKKMTSLFGSTYSCEQLFSKLKHTKSKLRAALTDGHLDNVLLLTSTSLPPNIEKLSSAKQHQVSH